MNEFLEHYIGNKITPVKQDISNLNQHFSKRISLYTILGIPPLFFKDKRVVEIGPGGGYNPLVTQSFSLKQYDLVEPNQYAIENINQVFKEYNVDISNINIYHSILEDFKSDELYDIVICEGLIPGLENKYEVLEKLDKLLAPGGVMVVTSADEVSYLFEILRHYIAYFLVKEDATFDEKLDVFEAAFSSHLNTLKGMSRFKRDWCADNLMGTMHFNYNFSFKECITFFNSQYSFYNSSPSLFLDYRWYKEIPIDSKEKNSYFLEQFTKRRHNLLHYQTIYGDRSVALNDEVVQLCKELFIHVKDTVIHKKDKSVQMVRTIDKICDNVSSLSSENKVLVESLQEVAKLIKEKDFTVDAVSDKYKNFQHAFGRGTLFISLIKE